MLRVKVLEPALGLRAQVRVRVGGGEHPAPRGQRLGGIAQPVFDVARPQPHQPGIGSQALQLLQVRAGLSVASFGGGDQCQAFDGAGVLGQRAARGVEARVGLSQTARAVERAAQFHQQIGIVGCQRHGVLIACRRQVVAPLGHEACGQRAQMLQLSGVG